jgi:hypothetical protein
MKVNESRRRERLIHDDAPSTRGHLYLGLRFHYRGSTTLAAAEFAQANPVVQASGMIELKVGHLIWDCTELACTDSQMYMSKTAA